MPAFQFYPADWRKDPGVGALSRHDRSVWFDMLCIMHESDERGVLLLAGQPVPEDALARMLNLDNQTFNQTLTNILTYGVASRRESDGAIYSRRMVKDEMVCQVRREAGKKGGNPNLVNQKTKQKPTTRDNQKPTPSSSTSSSTSSNEDERTAGEQADSASLLQASAGAGKEGGRTAAKPREFLADEAPTFLSGNFNKFVDKSGYSHVDKAHYLLRIQRKAEKLLARTDEGWENYILEWLDRDKRGSQLVMPAPAGAAHTLPVDNTRFGPAARPATTGYSIAAKLEEQRNNQYL